MEDLQAYMMRLFLEYAVSDPLAGQVSCTADFYFQEDCGKRRDGHGFPPGQR